MFTLFTFIVSTIFGMIAYRFAANHVATKPNVSGKTEFLTKSLFSFVGGLIGLVIAVLLYGFFKAAIVLVIIAGGIYLIFAYKAEITRFLKTGKL